MQKFQIGEKVKAKLGLNHYTLTYGNLPEDYLYPGNGYEDALKQPYLTVSRFCVSDDMDTHVYFFKEIKGGLYQRSIIGIDEIRNDKISQVFSKYLRFNI